MLRWQGVAALKNIFISYRKVDSEDITGRIYDRLLGYFGPSRVFMDIDALLAGVDYRSQITEMLSQCDVVLPIIGDKWLTATDENGKLRLDNPEDLLRLEVSTSLSRKNVTVVPILVHGAKLPEASDLPPDLAPLAEKKPSEVRSGLRFNADLSELIERLEGRHGVLHPDRRFRWEWLLVAVGVVLIVTGAIGFVMQATPWLFVDAVERRIFGEMPLQGQPRSSQELRAQMWNLLFFGVLPGGTGLLSVVIGKWICCGQKDRDRETAHFMAGLGRRPAQKSRLAVLCFAFGLSAYGFGLLTAIPALICGVWGYWDILRRRGWVRGRLLIAQGMLYAVLGSLLQIYVWSDYFQTYAWVTQMEQVLAQLEKGEQASSVKELDQTILAHPDYPAGYYLRAKQKLGKALGAGAPPPVFGNFAPAPPESVPVEPPADLAVQLDALADYTRAIDLLRSRVAWGGAYSPSNNRLRTALQARAEVYRNTNQGAKAEQDLEEANKYNQDYTPSLFEGQVPALPAEPAPAPAPAPEAAPLPPAPVVDPSAAAGSQRSGLASLAGADWV